MSLVKAWKPDRNAYVDVASMLPLREEDIYIKLLEMDEKSWYESGYSESLNYVHPLDIFLSVIPEAKKRELDVSLMRNWSTQHVVESRSSDIIVLKPNESTFTKAETNISIKTELNDSILSQGELVDLDSENQVTTHEVLIKPVSTLNAINEKSYNTAVDSYAPVVIDYDQDVEFTENFDFDVSFPMNDSYNALSEARPCIEPNSLINLANKIDQLNENISFLNNNIMSLKDSILSLSLKNANSNEEKSSH